MKTTKNNLKKEIKKFKEIVAMKCLVCTKYQIKEIILCEIKGCPLWEYRPRQARGLYTLIKRLKQKNLGLYEAKNN
ncbi:hypothetical protein A2954_00510 [Candidatus Roizmanbacteria bacterium RIFCSPLOWO2_01_FULL_37_12]|uniref:Uncharacterized protein n=1 Tax=Candidatus Roizmanbacteria bacterium RIFCSPLOWO2_01_FULL_37_12 TaxID=1802056 RepID=A0A1F7I9R6_9BACT|nr:MAG: hypothetical protein A3D76_00865 [Candidatus Roizmanbacteria bacterium RIFCSPHIGHO2_02_FULL_37_9b]OGK40108.1 MAG: hypothetical protein A2954_00510 [Candidatus Roizmanbacteria bacterium RIFCSPLOWO2_01_FULL_37_12]